jgi:hypothetical protein
MSRKKKLIIISSAVLSVVAGFLFFYFMFGSSNQGIIKEPKYNPYAGEALAGADQQLTGQSFRLTHPGTYMQHQLPVTDTDIEIFQLKAGTIYHKEIMVIISRLPAGRLSQSSAYLLRSMRADLYTKRLVEVKGQQIEVYVSADGREQTAFVMRSDKMAVLAFTQHGGDRGKLTAEVDTLLQTLTWLFSRITIL